jgi:hypothetical protein
MIRRGFGNMGLGASYPTTGRAVSPQEFLAGYQAVATPNYPAADSSNPASWGGTVAIGLSLDAQRAYIRSLYEAASQDAGDGHGNYWEPAYPAYEYSANVPSWALPFLASQVAQPGPGDAPRSTASVLNELQTMVTGSNAAAAEAARLGTSGAAAGTSYQYAASAAPVHSGTPAAPGTPAPDPLADSGAGRSGLSGVPMWAWLAGAAVALWFVMEKN